MKNYIINKTKEIEKELATIEKIPENSFDADAEEKALIEPLFYLLKSGGKRLRPVLACLIADIFSVINPEITRLSLVCELVHNATLMIDDIEDESKKRRGNDCAYLKYGVSLTINAGNYWYFWPLKIVFDSQNLSTIQKELYTKLFWEKMIDLHRGQAMDIYWAKEKKYNISYQKYKQMSQLKTGSMLSMALLTGGIVAELDQSKLENLNKIAYMMGLAFQMRDDILDVTATDDNWGKLINQDIWEGKLTSLVVKTLEVANDSDRNEIMNILTKEKTDQDIIKIKDFYSRYNTIETIQLEAEQLVEDIKKSGKDFLPDNQYSDIFWEITDYLVKREK